MREAAHPRDKDTPLPFLKAIQAVFSTNVSTGHRPD
jgi:hypothetical protein